MKSPKVRLPPAAADEDRHPHGCLNGLLHFLDFNQRFHLRKMIAYKKHGYGIKSPKKMKQIVVSSACEGQESMDNDANLPQPLQMEDKGSLTNEGSENAIMMLSSQNSRGSSMDQESRRSITPLATRLLRTISIHRSEGNGYVDGMTPQTENPTVEHISHFGSFSADVEHINRPNFHDSSEASGSVSTADNTSQSRLDGPEKASPNQNGKDAKESESPVPSPQSKELLDIMVLLNSNRDLFLKLLSDPNVIANYLQSQQIPTPDRMLERLRSLPAVRSPCIRKSESMVDRRRQDSQTGTTSSSPDTNEESTAGDSVRVDSGRVGPSSPEFEGLRKIPKDDRASNRFKVIKRRIKDVIKDNGKQGHRISLDGVLDKIPYGRKLSDDVKKAKKLLERPASARYDTDKSKNIKRSQSVNESLDKYCRLFESTSSFKRASESSKLNREDSVVFQHGECRQSFGRIFSLPEFESCSSMEDGEYRAVYEDEEQAVRSNHEEETCEVSDLSRGLTLDDSNGNLLYEEDTVDEADISREPTKDSEAPIVGLECSISGTDRSQMLTDTDDNFSHIIQVDEKDEAEFNYVRDILWKSGLGGDDSSLYVEAECGNEAGAATDEPDTSLEHQLLFDVTNEVLLDIYDASFTHCPWLTCFDSRIRPLPARHHILEEVWANVRWYLKYQPQLDPTLDGVVARDFAKSDGWMELQYDYEYVGLELEDLIIDELLDELILELHADVQIIK